ncbi:MAG: hypothetical protein AAB614_01695 [Patescibacteria group bacterium]
MTFLKVYCILTNKISTFHNKRGYADERICYFIDCFFAGCATYETRVVHIDPSYNRVTIENNTQYILNEVGLFNVSLAPGESISANVISYNGALCYGRYEGSMEAYRVIGKDKNNNNLLQRYGQKIYTLSIDGRNVIYKGQSVDSFTVFREGDFSPNRPERHLVPPIRVAIFSCIFKKIARK